MKIEITTKKSFYRIYMPSKFWTFHWRRYYKRCQARGKSWLIWTFQNPLFWIDCWALNNPPLSEKEVERQKGENDEPKADTD